MCESAEAYSEEATFTVSSFCPILVALPSNYNNIPLLCSGNSPPDGCIPVLYNILSVPALTAKLRLCIVT